MKKLLILFFIFAIARAAFTAQSAADIYPKFAAVQTIASAFVMERHLSIAQKPLISSGYFYFERPGFLRWEYKKPFAHGIILNGNKAKSWREGKGGKKEIKDISNEPFAKIIAQQVYVFVSMDMAQIAKRYEVRDNKTGVTLLPKDKSAAQAMDKIILHFNAAQDAVTKVEMLDKSGDKTIINFEGTILNQPIPAAALEP